MELYVGVMNKYDIIIIKFVPQIHIMGYHFKAGISKIIYFLLHVYLTQNGALVTVLTDFTKIYFSAFLHRSFEVIQI